MTPGTPITMPDDLPPAAMQAATAIAAGSGVDVVNGGIGVLNGKPIFGPVRPPATG